MRTIIAVLLALCAPAAASAQEYFIGGDIFNYAVRPFRDRAERFQSARVEALQMRLAVQDESDQLTLENWGDNRADLKAEGNSLKLGVRATSGESYSPAKYNDDGAAGGAWGRFGRLEFEGRYGNQTSEKFDGTNHNEYNFGGGGAAFAFGPEKLSFGVHANVNRSGDEDWEEVMKTDALGAAMAFRTDLYELGVTADYRDFSDTKDSSNYDVPLKGPALGVQALLKPFAGFKAGLRGSITSLTADDAHIGAIPYVDYKASQNELGARLEWKADGLPLTVGGEYARFFFDPNYTKSGVFKKNESDYSLASAGAALKLLSDRLLLGAEYQHLQMDRESTSGATVTTSDSSADSITGGAEFWVLPRLALRGSVMRITSDGGSSDVTSTCYAAGAGYKGGTFGLDATLRHYVQDEDAVDPDVYNDARVTLSFKF